MKKRLFWGYLLALVVAMGVSMLSTKYVEQKEFSLFELLNDFIGVFLGLSTVLLTQRYMAKRKAKKEEQKNKSS